jgi:hypothetical protein
MIKQIDNKENRSLSQGLKIEELDIKKYEDILNEN